jgi:iron complex outermembrane receptor protein
MKTKLLATAIAMLSASAFGLDGKVTDENGQAIVGAEVDVVGKGKTQKTNDDGMFSIEGENVNEIHVKANGYNHKVIHLDHDSNGELTVELSRSIIEVVDVVGIPFHASVIETAMPVEVLSGEALRKQQAATLGDTLEGQLGVHSSFHANVASTPVIRGLSGPRVKLTQNSLDVSDVSRVGPDHTVTAEGSTAKQVEVFRGPATLFFGSGAIGGVVNVVDNRVPSDSDTEANWLLSYDTVNEQNQASFNAKSGTEDFAFYIDGFYRDSEDYEVPVHPELEHDEDHEDHGDEENVVENSAEESSGFTLGGSWLLDNGYVGLSVSQMDREYGIPGHGHGEEEEHEEGEEEGEEHAHEEEAVFLELEQTRVQMISELDFDSDLIRALHTRIGYTDYEHMEIEDGEPGTTFTNETTELRVDLLHQEFNHWKGGLQFQYMDTEQSATGEEAFTPASSTESFAIALIEEKHFGDVLVQLGARVETVDIESSEVRLTPLELGEHEEGEEEHEDEEVEFTNYSDDFTPFSLSAGFVWEFTQGYNIGLSYSHSQRGISAAEMLSFGPHLGTGTYEVGAIYELHQEGDDVHIEFADNTIEKEVSNNLDLSFRKFEGDVGLVVNLFYNQVDNYTYQYDTGFTVEFEHEHGEEEEEEGEEEHGGEELPVFLFDQADADFFGLEAQVIWRLTDSVTTTFFTDFVEAELDDGSNLPRTSPMRYGAKVDYSYKQLDVNLSWTRYDDQNDVAPFETETDGYDMLDAYVNYNIPVGEQTVTVFVKGENLLDEEARVHTSFLKDLAPRPGRNFSLGVRGTF